MLPDAVDDAELGEAQRAALRSGGVAVLDACLTAAECAALRAELGPGPAERTVRTSGRLCI